VKPFQIAGRTVGSKTAPFIIAEMSGNHDGDLDRALAIVDAAAQAGVDALKLQTYTAETMTLDSDQPPFVIEDPKSLWHGRSLYELYEEAHTPWDWHKPLLARCSEQGLIGFSTPFDFTAVDFLESLDVPAYKVASFENTDLPLLVRIAKTGKPVIMSTGMASPDELDLSVRTLRQAGCTDLVLLKCTSAYPAPPEAANLKMIPTLQERYQCQVGLSDHTLGIGVAVAAVALGATIVEKHFTLSRADDGVDAAFSMEPAEMAALVQQARLAQLARGEVSWQLSEREQASLAYRRSLWVIRDLAAGDEITADDIRAFRPAGGLMPEHYQTVLGRRVAIDVPRGTPVAWELFEN